MGGTQSLHTNAFDEALALPTELSARIALRTQQIIAYESGVADFIDPLAGSFAVEYLTNEIEKRAWEYIRWIEENGGVLKCIEEGLIQKEIQDAAYAYQLAIDKKEQIIVGVNEFIIEEEDVEREILKIDFEVEERQKARLREVKATRDNSKVEAALKKLKDTAIAGGNVMYPILEAVRVYASVGEISDVLREVYGEYKEKIII